MDTLGNFGVLGAIIALLAGINAEVVEHLFGGFFKGKLMYWVALVVGVALTFGAQALAGQVNALQPLVGLSWPIVLVVGVITGFVSTKLHGALTAANSGTSTASLSGIVKNVITAIGGNSTQGEKE